jgi:hypothetical protein
MKKTNMIKVAIICILFLLRVGVLVSQELPSSTYEFQLVAISDEETKTYDVTGYIVSDGKHEATLGVFSRSSEGLNWLFGVRMKSSHNGQYLGHFEYLEGWSEKEFKTIYLKSKMSLKDSILIEIEEGKDEFNSRIKTWKGSFQNILKQEYKNRRYSLERSEELELLESLRVVHFDNLTEYTLLVEFIDKFEDPFKINGCTLSVESDWKNRARLIAFYTNESGKRDSLIFFLEKYKTPGGKNPTILIWPSPLSPIKDKRIKVFGLVPKDTRFYLKQFWCENELFTTPRDLSKEYRDFPCLGCLIYNEPRTDLFVQVLDKIESKDGIQKKTYADKATNVEMVVDRNWGGYCDLIYKGYTYRVCNYQIAKGLTEGTKVLASFKVVSFCMTKDESDDKSVVSIGGNFAYAVFSRIKIIRP